MDIILLIAGLFISKQYLDYQIETGNKSIQGFLQYLKSKYYDKPNGH